MFKVGDMITAKEKDNFPTWFGVIFQVLDTSSIITFEIEVISDPNYMPSRVGKKYSILKSTELYKLYYNIAPALISKRQREFDNV